MITNINDNMSWILNKLPKKDIYAEKDLYMNIPRFRNDDKYEKLYIQKGDPIFHTIYNYYNLYVTTSDLEKYLKENNYVDPTYFEYINTAILKINNKNQIKRIEIMRDEIFYERFKKENNDYYIILGT